MIRIMSLNEHRIYESDENIPFDIDESLLDELVELVGSEEKLEEAAMEAYTELEEAAEKGDVEMNAGDVPEKLVIASLIVKLSERGDLSISDAEGLIEKYLG